MAGSIWKGYAKPEDPIYKEGWSIHIGPLLGTEQLRPSTQQKPVAEAAKKNNAAAAPAVKAKRRRKR